MSEPLPSRRDPPAQTLGAGEPPDAAARALADALRLSFAFLKWVLLILVAIFCLSGLYRVREGEAAVRLHLGAVTGRPRPPGGPYFAWPRPVDEVLLLPTAWQSLSVDKAFWFHREKGDEAKKLEELAPPPGGLQPGLDGYLLTGDQQLVHGRWTVTYRIEPEEAEKFVRHVGWRQGEGQGPVSQRMLQAAERLVQAGAERAILHVVARSRAEDLIRGSGAWDSARAELQSHLDRLQTGLRIEGKEGLKLVEITAPLLVRADFKAATIAESERMRKVEAARGEESKLLLSAAGPGYQALLAVIGAYEEARARNAAGDAARAETALYALLDGASAAEALAPLAAAAPDEAARRHWSALLSPARLEGESRQRVAAARAEAERIKQELRAEKETFVKLLPQYRRNPQLIRTRRWQETLQQVFSGKLEKFHLPAGAKEVYLELNRDPKIKQERERDEIQEKEKNK